MVGEQSSQDDRRLGEAAVRDQRLGGREARLQVRDLRRRHDRGWR